MRLRSITIYRAVIIICAIVLSRFDLLFYDTNSINLNLQRTIIAIMICACNISLYYRISNRKKTFGIAHDYLKYYFLIILIYAVYSWLRYGYSTREAIVALVPFVYVAISIPITYVIHKDKDPYTILRPLALIGFINLVIRLIGGLTYNFTSAPIFINFASEYGTWTRGGLQRVDTGVLFPITFIYFISKIFEKKRIQGKYLMPCVVMYIFAIVLNQARGLYISMIVSTYIVLFYTRRKSMSKARVIMLGMLGLLILLISGRLNGLINSFALLGSYGYSTQARLETFSHFWEMLKNSFFFGIGLLENFEVTSMYFYRNAWNIFYIGDIGIFGVIFKFGISSIYIVGRLVHLMIDSFRRSINEYSTDNSLVVASVSFFLLNSLFTGLFEGTSGFSTGIILGLIAYSEPYSRRVWK